MRVADLGYAPCFQAFFVASGWFRQSGVTSSYPKWLTPAVRLNITAIDEVSRVIP
jgi:hypothetical protein